MELQLHIFILLVGTASATLNVEVRLGSYSNPSSDDCVGGNCDGIFGTCDNIFTFCVGHVGSTVCLDSVIAGIVEDDDFTFTPATVAALEISNPLVFTDLDASAPLELCVYVVDYDADDVDTDRIDEINVPFDGLRLSSTFGPLLTYRGRCGTASISLSLRITSNCPDDMYGPGCTETCMGEPDLTYCDYLGEMQCIGNFKLPNCTECLDNFQGPNCEPTDDPFVGSIVFYIINGVGSVIVLTGVFCCAACCFYSRRRRYKR